MVGLLIPFNIELLSIYYIVTNHYNAYSGKKKVKFLETDGN